MDKAVSIITQILVSLFLRNFSKAITSLASFTFGINIASGLHLSKTLISILPSSVSKAFTLITCSLFLFTPEFIISIIAVRASFLAFAATESSKS